MFHDVIITDYEAKKNIFGPHLVSFRSAAGPPVEARQPPRPHPPNPQGYHCTNQKVAQKLKNVKNKKHHLRRNSISQNVTFFVFHICQLLSHFLISVTMEPPIWQSLATNCEEDLSFQWGGQHFIRIQLILVYKDDDL